MIEELVIPLSTASSSWPFPPDSMYTIGAVPTSLSSSVVSRARVNPQRAAHDVADIAAKVAENRSVC